MIISKAKGEPRMYSIKVDKLTIKDKDVTAVDALDLKIERGELFALLGVNGAGKTTAIKMLSCLTAPTSGCATVGGYDIVTESNRVKGIIAVSPQESAIAANLTTRENLDFICSIHGFSREKTEKKLDELSRRLGLDKILDKRASKLSGGWQRRLSIAMALISEPEILFLDEPTLGLDVIARSELWDIIRALKGKATIILTTHYMEEAESLSDRVAIMKDGRLIICDTPEKIKEITVESSFEKAVVAVIKGVSK